MGLVESGKMPKPLTNLLNISRRYSIWIFQWGLACCAIEMGAALAGPRYDVMRLGVIPFPASPRQADLVVVSGTVTDKMAPALRRLYDPCRRTGDESVPATGVRRGWQADHDH